VVLALGYMDLILRELPKEFAMLETIKLLVVKILIEQPNAGMERILPLSRESVDYIIVGARHYALLLVKQYVKGIVGLMIVSG
jgi:hypothetical protein